MHVDNLDLTHPLVWTVDDVLTRQECNTAIERIEALGPSLATINTDRGHIIRQGIRNNGRVTIDDDKFSQLLFQRVRNKVPDKLQSMSVVGANERLRCYRYQPGEYFGLHYDGSYARNERERSLLTFMVYLNDMSEAEGGETNFPELEKSFRPRQGSALLFQHMLLHEGARVVAGTKYAIRSDIMYQNTDS